MGKFALNAWYPIAWSRDIGRELTTRRVLGQDLVVYRNEDGSVSALEDACPHRLAPLSLGKLCGNTVQCGYHGLVFDGSGRCTHAPGMDKPGSQMRVRAYPTALSMGLVWVWTGAPEKAAATPVFHLPQYEDPGFSLVEGDALSMHSGYLNLADNLCDPSHVAYVHLTTLASQGSEETPVRHAREGRKMLTWRWVIDGPLIGVFQGLRAFPGNVDRWHYYHYHAPCVAVIDFGSAPTGTGALERGPGNWPDSIQMFACHFITPVDESHCVQHWLLLKNMPGNPELDERLRAGLRLAFNEDKRILEGIQRNEDQPRAPDNPWHRIRLGLDGSNMKMRRIVDEMIEEN